MRIATLLQGCFHLIGVKSRQLCKAITILLEVLESLTYHFVEDEHYNYFDDMYSPDYICLDMMEAVIDVIKSGDFPDEELLRVKEGLEKLMQTEAYEDYGVPFALNVCEKF